MKIFLSSLETAHTEEILDYLHKFNIDHLLWNLMSFYYLTPQKFKLITSKSKQIMIDSGAHSFQKGKTVNWTKYTEKYAEFIKEYDNDKILGYFEMDVDNRIGFNKVLKLRNTLEQVTNKIIPVWHKNRGIKQFTKMCKKYSGKIVAISGFQNEDIKDYQFKLFLKKAWEYNCKLHGLGITRKKVLDKVPFDFVDSSSWRLGTTFYRIGGQKVNKQSVKNNWGKAKAISYKRAIKKQLHYYNKWKMINND